MPEFLSMISYLYYVSTLLYTSSKMFHYMDRFLCKTSSGDISPFNIITFYLFILIYCLRWCSSLILLSEDIKNYPGPTSSSGQCFSICHWNLNSITAHNFAKLSLLTAYNLVHSFDIICLSETYLNSETPPNDTRLELPGCNLLRSNHPCNNKRGGACVYYKSTLPLRILNISNLDECTNFNKICRFIYLYRPPSQKQNEFQEFESNLEMNLDAFIN